MSAQGTSCQNFFSSPLNVHEFFFRTMVLCKNFFLMHMHLQDIFFKITQTPTPSPPPPPPCQKLNDRPLNRAIYLTRLNYILIGSHANKDSPVIIMLCKHGYDVTSHFLLDFIKEIIATGTNIFWYKQATLNSFKFTVVLTTGDLWDTIVCGIFIFVFI